MKKLIKVSSYTLATALVLVLSQTAAFAAGETTNSSTLSFGQVFGGIVLLVAAILLPSMKSFRKAKA